MMDSIRRDHSQTMKQLQAAPNDGKDYIANVPSLPSLVSDACSNFLCPVGMSGTKDKRRFRRPSNLSNGECRE